MEFYRALSEYYDEIFPLKAAQKSFLTEYLRSEFFSSILDVGCATGSLALELAQKDVHVLGVDLSEEMVKISQQKAKDLGSEAVFLVADMRSLENIKDNFDGIVCIGNTLPHVSGLSELNLVLERFGEKGTHLVVQTVNYDRILANNISELPVIRTEHLNFQRFYSLRADGTLDFTMKIEFPKTRQVVTAVNILFPLKLEVLKNALLETGWDITGLWGNFDMEPWTEDSPATILSATRSIV